MINGGARDLWCCGTCNFLTSSTTNNGRGITPPLPNGAGGRDRGVHTGAGQDDAQHAQVRRLCSAGHVRRRHCPALGHCVRTALARSGRGAHAHTARAGPRGPQVDVSAEDVKLARGGAETQQQGSGRQGIAWRWRIVAASRCCPARCNSDPLALLLNMGPFPLARRMTMSSLVPSGCTCWGTGAGLSAGT